MPKPWRISQRDKFLTKLTPPHQCHLLGPLARTSHPFPPSPGIPHPPVLRDAEDEAHSSAKPCSHGMCSTEVIKENKTQTFKGKMLRFSTGEFSKLLPFKFLLCGKFCKDFFFLTIPNKMLSQILDQFPCGKP